MNSTIVIYHGGCRDGFCAAWVYNKYIQNRTKERLAESKEGFILENGIEYYPGYYGQEPPDVKGKNVIILDFCYPLEIMKQILNESANMLWLDHHKTAQPIYDWLMNESYKYGTMLDFRFDNNRSGAGLTWDYFFPNEPRPWLVDYVEDRDLWVKKLAESDEVNAYIACLEFNFETWNIVNDKISLEQAKLNGDIAIMKTEQYVNEVCKNVYFADIEFSNIRDSDRGSVISASKKFIKYNNIPTVNICQVDCSEVLHELCKRYPESPFSLYWFKRHDGMYQYGLRSIGDFDVSTVAKLFGGGGHKNAAGFQLNYLLEELK